MTLQERFLELLPRIETHARIAFRHIRCPGTRADRIAETVATSWKWFCRLHDQGKDVMEFQGAFVSLAAKAVSSGRQVAGMVKAKDVLNERTQRRRGLTETPLGEALLDHSQSPPDEQAAFRIDFAEWFHSLPERDRRLVTDMVLGYQGTELAEKYGLSQGRISQKRDQFRLEWELL